MKIKTITTVVLQVLLGALLLVTPAFAGDDVAVVVNSTNKTGSLSLAELRKILNGEKRTWSGGTPVKLLVRSSGHERSVLLNLLGMSETDYKKYWTAQVYKGEAQAEPIALPSNGMQREALALYPGAIARMDSADVKPGMKVVRVDGALPGESNYPLR